MISIIVPVYNCMHTLERCVQAVCAQTIQDWELLLIDDGSQDESGALCDRLAAQDIRIRVFHKANGGVSSARNLGLDNASGDYIMFCDSDDWVEPDWCETMCHHAQNYPDYLPVCNYYRSRVSGESVNCFAACAALDNVLPKVDFFSLNRQELLGIPWNKIFRRSILEENRIRFHEDISLGEDLIFVLDYLDTLEKGLFFVNVPLYHYVQGNFDSLSVKYYSDLEGIYRVLYSRIARTMHSNPGAWEKWGKDYWRSYFNAFDRVFRNTLSDRNQTSHYQKYRYNVCVFHSSDFQKCRKIVLPDTKNILQKVGLTSNCYTFYWTTVVVSEWISSLRQHK